MRETSPEFITIVSGLPRSGTSLAMQMLQAGGMAILTDGVRSPDDQNPRGYHEYTPVNATRRDSAWVEQAVGKSVKVVSPLLKFLPPQFDYRVIHVTRHLGEVVASQRVMLARHGADGAGVSTEELQNAYRRQIAEVRAWLAAQNHMQTLEIDYREILRDPREAADRIRLFLDVPLDVEAMASAVDPQLYRQQGSP